MTNKTKARIRGNLILMTLGMLNSAIMEFFGYGIATWQFWAVCYGIGIIAVWFFEEKIWGVRDDR